MRDPGKVMQDHYDLQKVTSINTISPMRHCKGCKKRKSVGQFKAASEQCLQCVRRMPKVAA